MVIFGSKRCYWRERKMGLGRFLAMRLHPWDSLVLVLVLFSSLFFLI